MPRFDSTHRADPALPRATAPFFCVRQAMANQIVAEIEARPFVHVRTYLSIDVRCDAATHRHAHAMAHAAPIGARTLPRLAALWPSSLHRFSVRIRSRQRNGRWLSGNVNSNANRCRWPDPPTRL
jgi:hypothetical protein